MSRAPFPSVVVVADIVAKALKFHIANLEEMMKEEALKQKHALIEN